uniref:Basement membrane-specific heparan sulfate proteoglycan core protein n=1 Tax=Cacopsylla melanoneura TaxID=428564 RepID=A0A8D9EVV2_9HEMI
MCQLSKDIFTMKNIFTSVLIYLCVLSASACEYDEYRCDTGECIPASQRCDGRTDCVSGSDETGCPPSCNPNDYFICANNICIPKKQRCDKTRNCQDGSDEKDCPEDCSGGFQCVTDHRICLDVYQRCDRRVDCPDGSDEDNCSCRQDEFQCHNGTCLNIAKRCDNVTDCGGGEDEKNCPTYPKYEPSSCGPFEFRCNDGQCVDVRDECDGKNDCYDGTDEAYCTNRPLKCRSDEFACQSGRVCIPSYQKCDGIFQCLDESDELGCPRPPSNLPTTRPTTLHPNRVSCHWSKFSCHDGLRCVPMGAQCNGSYECGDFSDESNCATNYEGIQLKVYPDDQIIKEGREVVIQCRDEGSTRADVEWIRQDGAPLPHGSRNTRGRLVMPNVSARDSGVYICKALGYYPLTAASQIKAHVTVEKWVEPTTMPRKVCSDYEATCSNGDCIQKSNVCDGNYDCADGSDETRCSNAGCEPNEFRCANRRCIMKTWHCDGDDDCLDGTDEKDCPTNAPGSPCSYTQFQCSNRRQCVPKSFQCDGAVDCDDSSDEVGCSEPHIKTLPPPQVILDIGALFTITCVTVGNPTPLVSWRLNWNHIPTKCKATSDQGVGTLTCPDVQESDQGAYSCEAINSRGVKFATPDTILTVNRPNIPSANQCARGTFSDVNVISQRDCISCFCFGVSTDCYSSNMYTYVVPYPSQTAFRLVNVHLGSSNNQFSVDRDTQSPFQPYLRSMGRNSFKYNFIIWNFQLISDGAEPNVRQEIYPYFAFPDSFHGNQIKSYGGHIRYTVRYTAGDRELRTPDIIIDGNGYTLTYKGPETSSQQNTDFLVNAKLVPGNWYKLRDPRGQNQLLRPASREEIMVVLSNVEDILLKTLYTHGSEGETYITDIKFESARPQNTGQGKAIYVEECRCPAGYTGFSCEDCAPGFIRTPQGPWKGLCRRDDIGCPEGTYGDPSRNIPCQECPCPLTSPRNQFTRKCVLGSDNQPTCECPPGYSGRRCEYCSPGYMGNPLIANDYCRPVTLSCDPEGSESRQPDEYGRCRCKDLTTGLHCNQCKENAFHLAGSNPRGCISCFCMGVSERCSSSNLYRSQITTTFTRDIQDFKLVKSNDKDNSLSLNINPNSREIVFEDFESANQDVYYWSLPSRFLGDKVTSYGGNLTYSVRHVPVPGGQSSKNNAVDVEIVGGDGIHLLFYSQIPVEPNQPVTILAPLFEQFWQSSNGQTGNREQMLRTLSNIQHIFIKATYTTNTKEAGLRFVSLDTAEDRNTGQIRAHEVEQCVCPSGYTGLSCEICNAGYTTVRDGYTGHRCEPCNCNGRASGCDPFNGKCFDCQDFTYGDHCDICRPGYEGDPSRGVPCELQSTSSSCDCNPAGYYRCDENLQCECKVNVEGPRCDRCRPNTFDLSELHPEGCLQCFCSGLNATCRSSNLYVTQIPMQVYQNHGITLTDRIRQQTIDSGFRIDIEKNEIGYDDEASLRGQKLYWSLPQQFTGDRVTSYGGNLTWTQRYTAGNDAINFDDTDVVIFGNGISIYWNNKEQLTQEIKKTFQVQLMERGWRRLSQYGQRDASRSDLLTILSNVEAILIRASHASNTQSVFLSDVSLDTAIPTRTDQRATMVEQCSCPEGYTGYSCETCAKGFYRSYDRSCQRCPCNGNEISCGLAANNSVECKCLEGYTGSRCHSIAGIMMELKPTYVDQVVGSVIRFSCKYHSREPLSIEFETVFSGNRTDEYDTHAPQESYRHAQNGAERYWNVTISDGLVYVSCRVRNSQGVALGRLTTMIGTGTPVTQEPRIPMFPPTPSIVVSVRKEPAIEIIALGDTVRFVCDAHSVNSRPVSVRWSKENSPMPSRGVDDGMGQLIIRGATYYDSGTYICTATDNYDVVVSSATLIVGVKEAPVVRVYPLSLEVRLGEPAEFRCDSSGKPDPNIEWIRDRRESFNPDFQFRNGLLRIERVQQSDEGVYYCRATNEAGTDVKRVQLNIIRGNPVEVAPYPDNYYITIDPPEYTGPGGQQVILRCSAPYMPTSNSVSIKWSRKESGSLPPGAYDRDGTLTISNPSIADSGIYICTAHSDVGVHQIESQVNIATDGGNVPTSPPNDNNNYGAYLFPRNQSAAEGSQVTISCKPNDPAANVLKWTKHNQDSLSENMIVTGDTLIINSITKQDEGVYICTIRNPGGSEYQEYATVQVELRERPRIRLHPNVTQSFILGASGYIQCIVEAGEPAPTHRWERPAAEGVMGPNVKENAQFGLLSFSNIAFTDEGKYTCVAENSAGREYVNAQIFVHSLPIVTTSPSEHITVRPGDSLTLKCSANARPTPTVSWTKYIQPYDRNLPHQELSATAIYEITSVQESDAGVYACIAKNAAGQEEKRVTVSVESLAEYPNPSRVGGDNIEPGKGEDGNYPEFDNEAYTFPLGTQSSISCISVISQSPGQSIEWTKDNRRISDNPPPNIQIQYNQLWFNPVQESDAGAYSCILKSDRNEILSISTKHVKVREPPRITLHPQTQTVRPNENAVIKCSATGATPINYLWKPLRGYFASHITQENGELRFNGIQVQDEGKYTCIANNSVGIAESTAEVIVTALGGEFTQIVTAENDEVNIYEGGSAELRCNPRYALDRSYMIRWSRADGLPLPRNPNSHVLHITNARVRDGGRYLCELVQVSRNEVMGSDYVRLNVERRASRNPEVKIEQTSPAIDKPIMLGDIVDLECKPSSNVNVTWVKLGGYLSPHVLIRDKLLRVPDVRLGDSGLYRCSADFGGYTHSDEYDLKIDSNSLYPNDDPTFSPVSTKEAPYGSKITLTCNNDLETPVEYTWSKRSNGHTLPMKAFSVENTLTLQELKTSDAGMYVCKVSNKDMTVEIPTILLVTDSVPLFNQKSLSYLALPTFTDAHLHFSIEISFKPTDYNGLILYTGGKSNVKSDKDQGDFISFGLDDGYPVFRFDVGSGPAVVKSNFSVEMNQWHTVTLKRNRRKGMMFVDSQGPYSDESPGAFQGLDLSGLVYIGAVPEFGEIHPDNGFSQGFKGCISRVKYNKTEYELFKSSVERVGVDSCNTCKSNEHNPCINNGLCQDGGTKNGYTCICPPGFSGERCAVLGEPCYPGACGDGSCQDIEGKMQCLCPIGTTGKKCEQKLKILTPAFKHGSYLAYLTPKTRKFKVSIRLNPRDVKDGIVLYSGQSDDGLGDFISLSIKDKHMEFRFDTGSGLVVLRSRVALIPHEWVVVTIIKDYKEGKLSVGGEPLIVGSTPGEKLQVLTLRTPLYIGGYNIYHVTPSLNVEVSEGFHGCISTIDVLGYELDLINSAVDSANIMDCSDMESSASCSQKPCQNYGICYPTDLNDRGYNCSCLTGYSGEHCEQEANMCMSEDVCKNGGTCKVTANSYECLCLLGYAPPNCTKRISIGSEIHFLGEGYVELKKELIPERRSEESLSFDFITDDKNALLLWNGQPSYKNGLSREFIAVAIVNGYLEYSYDLGDGMVTIKFSKKRVNDGVKHNVNVTRINKLGSLELDNKIVGKGESPGSQGVITTRGSIYLGGTPNMDLMTGGRYVHPMSGLMMNIRIQDKQITSVGNSASSGYHVMPWIRSQQ